MATLQELVVKFKGDTSQLTASMSKAQSVIAGFASKAAIGIGAASAAMVTLGVKSANAIDAQRDLARSLGVTYTALENLTLVAGEAGVEQGSLASSIGLMQRNLIDAANGAGGAADALGKLGLSAKDLIALTPDQQFQKIAEQLSGIENPALKTALAMDIFGRSGRQLIPMLDDFAEASANAKEFNDRFGLSLSAIDTAKVDAAGDAMGRVGKIIEGVGNVIAVKAAPLVEALANKIIDIAPSAKSAGNALTSAMLSVAPALDEVRRVIMTINQGLIGMAQFALHANRGLLLVTQALGKNNDANLDKVEGNLKKLDIAAQSNVDSFNNMKTSADIMAQVVGKATETANDAAKNQLNPQFDVSDFISGNKDATESIEKVMDRLKSERESVMLTGAALESYNNLKEAGVSINSKLGRSIDEMTYENYRLKKSFEENKRMGDDMAQSFGTAFEDMIFGAKKAGDAMRQLGLDIIKAIYKQQIGNPIAQLGSSLFSKAFDGIGGSLFSGFGSSGSSSVTVPLKPSTLFADGGVVNRATAFPMASGGTGIMGEAGAEAIMPLKRGADGKLGVSGGGTTVNQTINVSAGVSQTVRAEMMRMLPDIKNSTIEGVRDAQNRGRL